VNSIAARRWQRQRTINAIEPTFSTARHPRMPKCVARPTFLGLAFSLIEEAENT
jgi:putative transposase